MSGWAAAAQVAAQIADKFIDSRSGSSAAAQSSKGRQFTLDMYRRQLWDQDERRNKRLQEIVADAQKAGVHPLFALGASSGSGSPGIALPGMPSGGVPSGGGGLAEGLRKAQSTLRSGKVDALQREAHDIAMERQRVALKQDQLAYDKAVSDMAREEQVVNAGPRMNEDGTIVVPMQGDARTFPLGEDMPVKARPLAISPRASVPERMTVVDDEGKTYRIYHKDLNAEELGQLQIAKREGGRLWAKFKRYLVAKQHLPLRSKKLAELRRQIREDYYQPIARRRPGRRGSGRIKPRR